jgi:hypothetical protein
MTQFERDMQKRAERDSRRLENSFSEIDKKTSTAETTKLIFFWVLGILLGFPLALLAFAKMLN